MNAVEIEQAITDLAEQPYDAAEFPYAFLEAFGNKQTTITRLRKGNTNKSPLWNMAIIASRVHLIWIATVCGKLETRYRYSNTLGWNTFPVPTLTEKNKTDLTRCAEDILLTRERHFPATIADLYDPDKMPDDLRLDSQGLSPTKISHHAEKLCAIIQDCYRACPGSREIKSCYPTGTPPV